MRSLILSLMVLAPTAFAENPLSHWVGSWTGECSVTRNSAAPSTTRMNLTVAAIADFSYSWAIQYEGEATRQYALIRQQGADTHWILDEKNGILIDRFFDASLTRMTSLYTISGRLFSWLEILEGDTITITADSYFINGARESGIPQMNLAVGSHQWSSTQKCQLRRN